MNPSLLPDATHTAGLPAGLDGSARSHESTEDIASTLPSSPSTSEDCGAVPGTSHEENEAPASGERPRVAMLIYSQMVLIDLVGPMTVLKMAGCDVDLVAKDRTPVSTDVGVLLAPTATFADAGHRSDVVFVPGGLMGSIASMGDDATLDWLRATAETAQWVTSVCTGSLVLGAAGLLRGYNATSHWGVRDLLPVLGATLVTDRVVIDRTRMTGGGATAGLDFGLMLAERLFDRETAERVELVLEYAPAPPFNVGTPELAGEARMRAARGRRVQIDEQARRAAEAAARKLSI